MSQTPPALGEAEFNDNKAIREYCERVRKATHLLGLELAMAAAELEAALSQIRSDHVVYLGVDSKVRAKLVARHLKSASDAMRSCAAAATRTHGSFRKHFEPELSRAGRKVPKPKFQFVED